MSVRARPLGSLLAEIKKESFKMSKSGMVVADKEKIRQNLIECDCDAEIITKFMDAMEQGHEKEALALLAKHRWDLLD